MKRIASVLLGLVFVSMASAATPEPVANSQNGSSSFAQRILLRKEQRSNRGTFPSSASVVFRRPSHRSSSLSSYSHTGTPVRGALRIDQVATATTRQIVGTVPYTLLSFVATAANEDIVLSTVKFHAEQGNLSFGSDYTLSTVNADGSLTRVAYATSTADSLSFTNIDRIIHRDSTQRFALRGRLIDSDASLAVGFLKTDPLFIQAQGLQYGRDLAPGIQVDTIPCNSQYVCRVLVRTQPAVLLYK